MKFRSRLIAAGLTFALQAGVANAQYAGMASPPEVKDDGAITSPVFELPFSSFASKEARDEFVNRLRNPLRLDPDRAKARAQTEAMVKPRLDRMRADYPYTSTKSTMGGVPVETFVPERGVAPANAQRVLINLHGGGFNSGGGGPGGAVESIPIASVARIRVIAVDYRLAPENRFPAASEDVAAVYRELLKTYKPENIGIYGCSAGGVLSAQAIPWFLKEKLPIPGAIGIFCASVFEFGEGDSSQFAPRWGSVLPILYPPSRTPGKFLRDNPYFAGASPTDPLAVPGVSKDVLRAFPPTLVLTGTRAPEMSAAVQTHLELTDLGVKSQLLLFDGLDHGFVSHSELPEAQRAYRLIARFFSENLGGKAPAARR